MKIYIPTNSKLMYIADLLFYGITILVLSVFLLFAAPRNQALGLSLLILCGLLSWTGLEYLIHRFILHGVLPFERWHQEHHRFPSALIRTPTILSASLILLLVFFPISLFSENVWQACALTLGLLAGYFTYSMTHHAIHHWHANSTWLKRRQEWHGLHHDLDEPRRYGVTSEFWDWIFRSR
ncbi:sterol desaturase family protein [Undibacterium sp. LX40W]|uniref:Sterol desaturase family protein n=1 Tax=Undibacterium nitidum TaxID=2762298 RepID=A0A923HUN3_9BURK|nr:MULTISPECIES: sterol desaturase family protein [Undibacterium]MBC3881589.1 sterol desaturase family protein [Undibacterium nitidum]MBC3891629.1 sterol desaturase family protein [Undibacterium sp. LX40W]